MFRDQKVCGNIAVHLMEETFCCLRGEIGEGREGSRKEERSEEENLAGIMLWLAEESHWKVSRESKASIFI